MSVDVASVGFLGLVIRIGAVSEEDSGNVDPETSKRRRLEQNFFWSCLKSECEMCTEIELPNSGIGQFSYPYMFPGPPSTLNEGASPDDEEGVVGQEWSWYYYLVEIAIRRQDNRVKGTFRREGHA
ncbi:hypothetical protein SAICODRAFT_25374 [Saitoella complicata NRRL Y-17804]|uniref:uncharacterized protein n=1 Tax=Saitoella complicata (strain BCRC 22490 / CBS 7301 / JCM 7358 / NBRC 10748 / NRRL Y-17804) TaxID=698492 RepID=UPI0008680DDA|nr:uncharacterized protein SAICODRAFT_25374 [Saitoella complicata NRRL Y-17804]ODQ53301.1 hypothetical protein SAICODRAFT_25374 [Saitoella complicata NRRL Y-17804]